MQVNNVGTQSTENRNLYGAPELGKEDFLKLLVTQLRLQDPLEPVKEQEFIAQLAQFSTLEGVNNLSSHLETITDLGQAILWQSTNQDAVNMLGRQVVLIVEDGEVTGTVTGISWSDGKPRIVVNGQAYDLGYIKELKLISEESNDTGEMP
ncbi:MAG: flagellar hook capping FlgD N-terminal domain-containing protein [bacterium]|jgi:flagellar basal-body rod modification protein FlgD